VATAEGFDVQGTTDEILNRRPAVGLALGVVRDGSLEFFDGHGVANIESRTPITEDTVFRVGSITKTFTALAFMRLWEQGLVDLDAPAHDYLRSFRLIPAKASDRPATVRHLLTHTAGVPEWVRPSRMVRSGWFGETWGLDERLPTLAEFYRGGLRLAAEPGTTFTYTDHGIAVVGQIVEDVSGKPLDRYFREEIFEPLGMVDTDLLRSERLESRLATGYRLRPGGPKAVTDRQGVTAAAGSVYSTPRDMARYVGALLGGGSNQHGSVLKRETLATMFEPHYQPDPRIPGMGLAFWRAEPGGHRAVEHQGIIPGFNSQIWVAPDDGVGVIAFTNGARNAVTWLTAETEGLLRHLIGIPDEVIRTDVPQRPEIWDQLCGWYGVRAQPTDMMAWLNAGAGAEVLVRRGRLMLRALSPIPALYRGLVLHPDDEKDPYVFRLDLSKQELGTVKVVFGQGPGGVTTGLLAEMPPLTLLKRRGTMNPRSMVAGALGVAATAIVLRRRRRRNSRASK
jgi:CubicO group peptidase (beta-lactamase class C family)